MKELSSVVDFSAEALRSAIKEKNPGIIVFESARYELLNENSVNILKEFQDQGGILIADEVTSGFRFSKKLACRELGLKPDIVVLGKALGSGYAISAVGVDIKYKEKAEDCFLSSTFWTEAVGFRAGIHTLKMVEQWDKFFEELYGNANHLREELRKTLNESGLEFKINTIPTMINFEVHKEGFNSTDIKSLICKRMLTKGYLFSTTIYPTLSHTKSETDKYISALTSVVVQLSKELTTRPDIIEKEILALGPIEKFFKNTKL